MIENDKRTFTVETIEGRPGAFLCLDNGKESEPIAKFLDETKILEFWDVIKMKWQVAHAQGKSGI